MEHIAESRLQELAARLEQQTQHSVMQYIGQFSQAEICSAFGCPPPGAVDTLHPLVFNMERGVHLDAQIEFLQACPDVQPFDLLLANELDDGCVRSGGRDVAAELARALGMYYVFGLEFIELTDPCGGMHGNAVFSGWPIVWAAGRSARSRSIWKTGRTAWGAVRRCARCWSMRAECSAGCRW